MEKTPKIIMQCPKCLKEFPDDANYCESCSVMLEPVEVEDKKPENITESKMADLDVKVSDQDEKIEDIRIDSLKTDIEDKFVFTLLLEINHLKKRLSKKENLLPDIRKKESGTEHSDFMSKGRKAEAEVEEITKKISKLESILENLKKKIEGDISGLETRIKDIKKPGLLSLLSDDGRYYSMLSSELKSKNSLREIIERKSSPFSYKLQRYNRLYIAGTFIVVLSLAISWVLSAYIFKTHDSSNSLSSTMQTNDIRKTGITEKDIYTLLEDIKHSNLKKDLVLWESRYSRSYLELKGKKENILEQWNKYNYKTLNYRVDKIQIQNEGASAIINWEMVLVPVKTGETKIIAQRLQSDFIIEDGKLKISSVKKED